MYFVGIFNKEGLNCITKAKSVFTMHEVDVPHLGTNLYEFIRVYELVCVCLYMLMLSGLKKVVFQFCYFILLLEIWSGKKWVLS